MIGRLFSPVPGPLILSAFQAIAGVLAALVAAGLTLFVIVGVVTSVESPGVGIAETWGAAVSVALIGMAIASPVVVVGVPIFYFSFRRMGWFKFYQSAAGGGVVGAIVFPMAPILSGDWEDLFTMEMLGVVLLGALLGAVGGLAFWIVAVRRLDQTGDT